MAWRSKHFAVTEKARKVASLEAMVIDCEFMASELARQIATEERRTGVRDPAHIGYSTFARATAQRRANLETSVASLRTKLTLARREQEEAKAELLALEPLETRDTNQQRREVNRTIADARPN
jgi:hypothetical protein